MRDEKSGGNSPTWLYYQIVNMKSSIPRDYFLRHRVHRFETWLFPGCKSADRTEPSFRVELSAISPMNDQSYGKRAIARNYLFPGWNLIAILVVNNFPCT